MKYAIDDDHGIWVKALVEIRKLSWIRSVQNNDHEFFLNKNKRDIACKLRRIDGCLKHEEKWNHIELHVGWLRSYEIK